MDRVDVIKPEPKVEDESAEAISCFDHVPRVLKRWFIAHFIIDYLIAIPLFLFPQSILSFLGWERVDPLASRVVAAALFAIGGISFFSRSEQVDTYKSLVITKIIWSMTAGLGILISVLINPQDYSWIVWIFIGIFLFFTILWQYWYIELKNYT